MLDCFEIFIVLCCYNNAGTRKDFAAKRSWWQAFAILIAEKAIRVVHL
jgi:hypothetical protein